MRLLTLFALMVLSFFITSATTEHMNAQDVKKPRDTVILSKGSKLGQVTFSHINHTTRNYNVDGTKSLACVKCHHTAQPAVEAAKDPLHKTVWPADRTTTLTAEVLEKDANAVGAKCSECHISPETKPKLLSVIPQVKFEGSDEPTLMTNQEAFHRNCGGCHDEVVKARPALTPAPPTSKRCLVCHKKVAG